MVALDLVEIFHQGEQHAGTRRQMRHARTGTAGGDIRIMEVLTPEVGRNPAELLRQIKAFQHVAKTGEVMPSGWEPGGSTLTPGPALVGRVWEAWKP